MGKKDGDFARPEEAKQTVEAHATAELGLLFDAFGGVVPQRGKANDEALFAAARAKNLWPRNKRMTAADFAAAIHDAGATRIGG